MQQRTDVVDDAGVIPRELLECEQRRAAHGRAVVLEPAAQKLDLRAEAELPDRAVRDGALAEVGRPRRGLELLVPLRRAAARARAPSRPPRAGRPRPRRRRASSALRVRAARLADVGRRGPDDLVVGVLLEHVRGPAGRPARGEDRREEIGRDAEVAVDRGRVEIDVRVEALLLEHRPLGRVGDREPVRLAAVVRELLGEPLEDQRARVVRAVERVAEAEELRLALEQLAHRVGRALRRAPLLEELHRRRVRAAVQRAARAQRSQRPLPTSGRRPCRRRRAR